MEASSVTEEEKQEFIKILSPLKFRVRLMRGENVLAKCSFEPDLTNSTYLNGKDDTRPTIRLSWNNNCRLADGGEVAVKTDDTLRLFERDKLIISAKLRRCETDCGIFDCR